MPSELTPDLRRRVGLRAKFRCEYCLLPQRFALHKHEPDHILAQQHGGTTTEDNLALACLSCNRYKGPNLGSLDPETGELVRFFHPRLDHWADHFELEGGLIRPRTPEARVTVKILRLNDERRVLERQRWLKLDP